MRRSVLVAALILLLALSTGCSKKKETEALKEQVTALQAQVTALEGEKQELQNQLDRAVLKNTTQRHDLEDLQKALEVRLMHHPLSEFSISPQVHSENGWLLVDGAHTFTLNGHEHATKVQFFWAEAGDNFKPQSLDQDTNGKDGWTWTGSLTPGHVRAFWAEVHYPGGVVIKSSALPLRSSGK